MDDITKLKVLFIWNLPKSLVRWCFIRMVVDATSGIYEGTDMQKITVMDVLKRWEYMG